MAARKKMIMTKQTMTPIAKDHEMTNQMNWILKLEGRVRELIGEKKRLREIIKNQSSMLRAFRKSMDSDLPFPSRDKLDALISKSEEPDK